MTPKPEDLNALHHLESTLVAVWAQHDDMNDYTVGRAYEAAFQHYRDQVRKRQPKAPPLTGLDLEAFNAVQAACEQLLASGAPPMKGNSGGSTAPVILEKLVDYLRELSRSVERHTKMHGRHGYLTFIRSFVSK